MFSLTEEQPSFYALTGLEVDVIYLYKLSLQRWGEADMQEARPLHPTTSRSGTLLWGDVRMSTCFRGKRLDTRTILEYLGGLRWVSMDAKTKRTTLFVAPDKPRAEFEDLPLGSPRQRM